MKLIKNLEDLFGPGVVLDKKEGDNGSNDLKDYIPIILNIKKKYYNMPDDKFYDAVVDCVLLYNSYSKKIDRTSNIHTLFKMSLNQKCIQYMRVKRNMININAVSYENLVEKGMQFVG